MSNALVNEFIPFLDKGVARRVYAINDDLVMKVALYQHHTEASWGIEQCTTEIDTYIKYGDKLPLCKIFVDMSTPQRVIMERVTPLSSMPNGKRDFGDIRHLLFMISSGNIDSNYFDNLTPVMARFANKILESGLTNKEIFSIVQDVDFNNVGIKDNDLIILDYGLN